MKSDYNDETKNEAINPSDRTTIKTKSTTYSFTKSWIENEALKDILVGLIADDYNKQL